MYPNYLARGYQGLHVKQANKKCMILNTSLIFLGCYTQSVNSPPEFAPSRSSFEVNENEIGKL